MKRIATFIFVAFSVLLANAQTIVTEDEPLAQITQLPGFSGIIHKWGFIGDSLSSGEFESHKPDGKKGYNDMYEYSWGQRMCRLNGTTGDNYSQGGETARGWIKNFWDGAKNNNNNISAKTDPKQGYIIALGVNDKNRGEVAGNPLRDIDMNDYNKNAETFAGFYGGIIQRIKSIQPDAKIFVVTMPDDGKDWGEFPDVIRKMPELFENVYLIDLGKYAPKYAKGTDFRKNFFMGGHLNAAGYEYTAWMMMNYIDWIIRHNMKDFSQAGFIGTNLKY